jgi:hypothetical protein
MSNSTISVHTTPINNTNSGPHQHQHLTGQNPQVYLFGGKTMSSLAETPPPPDTNASQQAFTYSVTNRFFSLETDTSSNIPEWARLADGPAGAALFDFIMVEVNGMLWIHGGESATGDTRSTLWSVRMFDNAAYGGADAAMYGAGRVALEPLWSVRGFGGIAARKQHCAAAAGDVIYFWGGLAGACAVLRIHPHMLFARVNLFICCCCSHLHLRIYVCIYIYICIHTHTQVITF